MRISSENSLQTLFNVHSHSRLEDGAIWVLPQIPSSTSHNF